MPPEPCCYSRFFLVNFFFPFLSFFSFLSSRCRLITSPLPLSICHLSVNMILLCSLSLWPLVYFVFSPLLSFCQVPHFLLATEVKTSLWKVIYIQCWEPSLSLVAGLTYFGICKMCYSSTSFPLYYLPLSLFFIWFFLLFLLFPLNCPSFIFFFECGLHGVSLLLFAVGIVTFRKSFSLFSLLIIPWT